jgi:uncharacterized protein YndB with AHSA1/START domain
MIAKDKDKESGVFSVTTPTEREILMTRRFEAPRRLVFDAYTKPEHLPHWMLGPEGWTMTLCEIDFRAGGKWRFGWSHVKGQKMEMQGVYQEVSPPERIVSTESWGGPWPETLNTTTFTEDGVETTIACRILYPSQEARDAALKSGMKEGVALSYNRLAAVLARLAGEKR